jgi:transcriptional regulator with XRE-family HTH domain
MMANLQRLGEVVRAERERRGLSQEALADLASVSRSHIGEIERGEVNLSFVTLSEISTGLGLRLGDLIDRYERRSES